MFYMTCKPSIIRTIDYDNQYYVHCVYSIFNMSCTLNLLPYISVCVCVDSMCYVFRMIYVYIYIYVILNG